MSTCKRIIAGVGAVALIFATWNLGVDFGNDAGFCVGYSVGDQSGKMAVADNPFCKAVKPEENQIRYAIREAYLYAIGDHT